VFYVLSQCILALRLTTDINYIKTNAGHNHHYPVGDRKGFTLGNQCDVSATYLKAMLGYFTFASIMEMVISMRQGEVRHEGGEFSDKYAHKLRVWLYIFAGGMSALLLIPLGFALYYQSIYDGENVFAHYYGRVTCCVFTILCIFLLTAMISFTVLKQRSFDK
jgi:hypothetical protein